MTEHINRQMKTSNSPLQKTHFSEKACALSNRNYVLEGVGDKRSDRNGSKREEAEIGRRGKWGKNI